MARPTITDFLQTDHRRLDGLWEEYRLEETIQALHAVSTNKRPALESHLRHLILKLEAVLQVHLEKEERVYLPLFEQHLTEEEQQRVLAGMHTAAAE